MSVTYKKSGVDIQKADRLVKAIGQLAKTTISPQARQNRSAFGSTFLFEKTKYRNPVLVSSTDGVGTKLMVANLVGRHDTVGIDLVAMNVNDVLCAGAKPLFFLDYIACGKIHHKVLTDVMRGIVKGCELSGCSLIGGETAEMPGIYKENDYDLAGFAVGVAEKDKLIDGSKIKNGDKIIGIASSGLHSNGFSLARKVFSVSEQRKWAKELLRPTRIYVKPVLKLLERFSIKGIAHITGGAFYEKLTKIIPQGRCAVIRKNSWIMPPIFKMIQKKGKISGKEMFTTFNMGIGMALMVSPKEAVNVKKSLWQEGLASWEIGEIINDNKRRIILE